MNHLYKYKLSQPIDKYNNIVNNIVDYIRKNDNRAYFIHETQPLHYQSVRISNVIMTTFNLYKSSILNDISKIYPDYVIDITTGITAIKIYDKKNNSSKPFILRVIYPNELHRYQFTHYTSTQVSKSTVNISAKYGDVLTKETLELIQVYHSLGITILDKEGNEPMFSAEKYGVSKPCTLDDISKYAEDHKIMLVDREVCTPLKNLLLLGLKICTDETYSDNIRKLTKDRIITYIIKDDYPSIPTLDSTLNHNKLVNKMILELSDIIQDIAEHKKILSLLHDKTVVDTELIYIFYDRLNIYLDEYYQ